MENKNEITSDANNQNQNIQDGLKPLQTEQRNQNIQNGREPLQKNKEFVESCPLRRRQVGVGNFDPLDELKSIHQESDRAQIIIALIDANSRYKIAEVIGCCAALSIIAMCACYTFVYKI